MTRGVYSFVMLNARRARHIQDMQNEQTAFLDDRRIEQEILLACKKSQSYVQVFKDHYEDYGALLERLKRQGYSVQEMSNFSIIRW